MAYQARVYRILIASPSDVSDERELAVKTIQEWNDLNSPERQVVLLPLRWETHAAPEYGKRPQQVLNRQIVDRCDLLIGIFWTRVGSPTGAADSGTIEEIDRVAKAGKPVMLYFSQLKQDPSEIDLDQLSRLRKFKQQTYPKALVEHYSNIVEFRDKLAKQIEIQLRSLMAEDNSPPESGTVSAFTDIRLQFATTDSGKPIGDRLELDSTFITVPDFAGVPDYEDKTATATSSLILGSGPNTDYYRQAITFAIQRNLFHPVRFSLKNEGQIGARDVFLDITVASADGPILCITKAMFPSAAPSESKDLWGSGTHLLTPDQITASASVGWQTQLEIPALQPKREISPGSTFLIGAESSRRIEVTARIYADTLPEPATRKLTIDLKVKAAEIPAAELLPDLKKLIQHPKKAKTA